MFRLRYAVFLVAAALPLFAQRPPAAESPVTPAAEEKPAPIPSETTSVTDHELQLDGKTIHYKATAATMLIDGDDGQRQGRGIASAANGFRKPARNPSGDEQHQRNTDPTEVFIRFRRSEEHTSELQSPMY